LLTLLTSGQERGHVLVLLPQSIKRNPVLVSFSRHWTQRQIYYLKRFGKLEKFWGEPETDDFIIYLFIGLFAISWATPVAYGDFQARGRIRAVAAGLHQSHSNAGSEPRLQPTPQLTAMPDPQPTEQVQGPNP